MMFNIALVNHPEKDESQYIKELKKNKCQIHPVNMEMVDDQVCQQIKEMDAVIIKESSLEEIGRTCESIIKIRNLTDQFIWVLSENSTKINRIVYLQLGSDGTFDKRTDSDEFGLYVSSTLERRREAAPDDKQMNNEKEAALKEALEIQLVPSNFSVAVEGKGEVSLTKLEYKALESLIDNRGEALSYKELYKNIWGTEKGDRKYRVANLVFHLRKKLDDDSLKPKYIKTVRSKGYMIM